MICEINLLAIAPSKISSKLTLIWYKATIAGAPNEDQIHYNRS